MIDLERKNKWLVQKPDIVGLQLKKISEKSDIEHLLKIYN